MFELNLVEMIGYTASALVVASLAMSSVVKLRILSLTGSCAFLVYAVMIQSVPIVLTNAAIAGINIWYLRAELGLRHELGVVPIPPDSPFLADFLSFHLDDIRRYQPDAHVPDADSVGDDTMALLLTRDGLPAGVVVGRRQGEVLHVAIDYVLRAYRDSRLGEWLFGEGSRVFRAAGLRRLVSQPGTEPHRSYLEQVGFRPERDRYVLELRSQPAR